MLDLERENNRTLVDIGRERLRDLENVGIREARRTDDTNIRQDRSAQDIEQRATTRQEDIQAQSDALAIAIRESLTPLLSETETDDATTQLFGETVAQQSVTAGVEAENAEMLMIAATGIVAGAEALPESAIDLIESADELKSAARVQGLFDAASALEGAAGELSLAVVEFAGLLAGWVY